MVFFLCTGYAKAQLIPNYNYEHWNQIHLPDKPYVSPSNYETSNDESYFIDGSLSMKKIPGLTGYAIKLETIAFNNGQDTSVGTFMWGEFPKDESNTAPVFKGGFPFSDANVSGIEMDLRYNVNINSPALLIVQFKKNGLPIGGGNSPMNIPGIYAFAIAGDQATWSKMSFPFMPVLPEAPDSAVILISSNNVADGPSSLAYPGNFVEVDNIAFTGTTQLIPGGDLDGWETPAPVEIPQDWNVDSWTFSKGYSLRSFMGQNDFSSLYLQKTAENNHYEIGRATLGQEIYLGDNNALRIPGMKLDKTPKSVGLYYKYQSTGIDTAYLFVQLTKFNSTIQQREIVGEAHIPLTAASDWTFISRDIFYSTTEPADSAFIRFEAGRWGNPSAKSELYADNVKFHFCDEPSNIIGPVAVCPNTAGAEYLIEEIPGTQYSWSVPSDATIASGQNSNKIVVDFGTVFDKVTVIQTFSDGCTPLTVDITVSEATAASANAGDNINVCSGNSAHLMGSFSGASTIEWSSAGQGTFSDVNDPYATYSPTIEEAQIGVATLTLTTIESGSCAPAEDNITINIVSRPSPNPGNDFSICENSSKISLNGTVSSSATSLKWSTINGTGNFGDSAASSTIYNLTPEDIAGGFMIFELKGINPYCIDQEILLVTIEQLAAVVVGDDEVVCSGSQANVQGTVTNWNWYKWNTTGDGTFGDSTMLTTTYSPGVMEIAAGVAKVYLKTLNNQGCPAVSDTLNIMIDVCTGITTETIKDVMIFPNPASSIINIEFSNWSPATVKVMDTFSQVIITLENNSSELQADLSNLPSGVYYLMAESDEKQIIKKFVKE